MSLRAFFTDVFVHIAFPVSNAQHKCVCPSRGLRFSFLSVMFIIVPRSSWNGTSAFDTAREKNHWECEHFVKAAMQRRARRRTFPSFLTKTCGEHIPCAGSCSGFSNSCLPICIQPQRHDLPLTRSSIMPQLLPLLQLQATKKRSYFGMISRFYTKNGRVRAAWY
jgi:hypothetical protein